VRTRSSEIGTGRCANSLPFCAYERRRERRSRRRRRRRRRRRW
jgi:hypothetical protein